MRLRTVCRWYLHTHQWMLYRSTGRQQLGAQLELCSIRLGCQSGVWKPNKLSLVGKDSQSGLVGAVLSYAGNDGSLSYYCKQYNETIETSALVAANLFSQGVGQIANYSAITVYIQVGSRIIGQNNSFSTTAGSGFSASTSIAEFLSAGSYSIRICVAGRSLSNWTTVFSIGVSK